MEPSKIQVVSAKDSESLFSSEDDDVLFLDVSPEELDEFEKEEMALNAAGSKRKRENDEVEDEDEDDSFAQKRKYDMTEDAIDLLCITEDKLFRIQDSESQLRRFVLISNLEQRIEKDLF